LTPPPNISPQLSSNLRALAHTDRNLVVRLCLPATGDHLVGEPPIYHLNRSQFRLTLQPEEVTACLDDVHGQTLVIGMGLGELVLAALERADTVSVWERDPMIVRAALARHDFTAAIRSKQLRIHLGIDLIRLQETPFDAVVHHPFLAQIYPREVRLIEGGVGAKRALICAGGLFVDDVASALERLGYSVYTWDIHRLSSDELDQVVARFEPEVVFAINHTHGLTEACHRLGRPLVVWEIDPATDHMQRCEVPTEHVRVFTYRAANVGRFQAAGFRHVQYMPLAANTDRRGPGKVPPGTAALDQVCFVGASMLDQAQHFQALLADAWSRHFGDAQAGMETLGRVLSAQRELGGQYCIPGLVRAHMADLALIAQEAVSHNVTAMVAEIAAAERRLNVVAGLGSVGIHVWGDAGWKATEAHGARYMGFAGHDRALSEIYRAGRVHVDVARIYQQDIVPMRIFDILACGGAVIAEHSPALEALFTVGEDLDTWKTGAELQAKVAHYLAHPEAAAQLGRRGMQTVQASHTIAGRVQRMLASLNQDISRRSVV